RGAVSRQLSSCLKTGDSRQSANKPVAANAAGAGGGRHRRYPPGREAIYIPGRPGLEDHGGLGSRAKSRRFLRAVAERFRCTPPLPLRQIEVQREPPLAARSAEASACSCPLRLGATWRRSLTPPRLHVLKFTSCCFPRNKTLPGSGVGDKQLTRAPKLL